MIAYGNVPTALLARFAAVMRLAPAVRQAADRAFASVGGGIVGRVGLDDDLFDAVAPRFVEFKGV